MATARKVATTRIRQVEETINEVVLTLSEDEAQFLLDLLAHVVVGASGRRKHSDRIVRALEAAGFRYTVDASLVFADPTQRIEVI